uniref:Uncharacterized protein n=1 Tax=Rhizoctonia solani TaxID=456999 RepID=N0ACU8_9AGAM|nr:hypothetical protein RSOL_m00980 [Rhizoctonia solani]AGK45414.1 hypothetical protein RSOL_m00980 [Rhizoctonia solani]
MFRCGVKKSMIFLCVNLYGPYSFSCMVLNKFSKHVSYAKEFLYGTRTVSHDAARLPWSNPLYPQRGGPAGWPARLMFSHLNHLWC